MEDLMRDVPKLTRTLLTISAILTLLTYLEITTAF